MSHDGLAVLPRGATGCLRFVIVVFPNHTHSLTTFGGVNVSCAIRRPSEISDSNDLPILSLYVAPMPPIKK